MHYEIRLYIVIMFHVHLFEPYTCMVIEGFNALEMHLLLLLLHGGLVGGLSGSV